MQWNFELFGRIEKFLYLDKRWGGDWQVDRGNFFVNKCRLIQRLANERLSVYVVYKFLARTRFNNTHKITKCVGDTYISYKRGKFDPSIKIHRNFHHKCPASASHGIVNHSLLYVSRPGIFLSPLRPLFGGIIDGSDTAFLFTRGYIETRRRFVRRCPRTMGKSGRKGDRKILGRETYSRLCCKHHGSPKLSSADEEEGELGMRFVGQPHRRWRSSFTPGADPGRDDPACIS